MSPSFVLDAEDNMNRNIEYQSKEQLLDYFSLNNYPTFLLSVIDH